MRQLEDAGWEATDKNPEDEIADTNMHELFDEADNARRDSEDLIVPKKVQGICVKKFHLFVFRSTLS